MSFFADSEDEAERRFRQFFDEDPFPDIPAALLNSTDIRSYVGATGMIFPFDEDDGRFKTASYEVDLLGKCVYWDEHGQKQVRFINRGEEFILRKNSIAFVTLEPLFRLPQYIALRFNLKITHVYRGILLGTGPLVDPGYRNRLSMPLHNLTTNDYRFTGGEGLIWMEFTKLNHPSSCDAGERRPALLPSKWSGELAGFPPQKNSLGDVEDYIRKADPHRPVRSSIPEAIHDAQQAITTMRRFQVGAALGLTLTVLVSVYPIVSLVHDVNNTATNARELLDRTARELSDMRQKDRELRQRLDQLERQLKEATPTATTSLPVR